MILLRRCLALLVLLVCCAVLRAQTAGNLNHFNKDGLSFDYPAGWVIQDESNSDAQTLKMARADGDIQMTVFVHRGRISADKMPDAKKAFLSSWDMLRTSLKVEEAKPAASPTPKQKP